MITRLRTTERVSAPWQGAKKLFKLTLSNCKEPKEKVSSSSLFQGIPSNLSAVYKCRSISLALLLYYHHYLSSSCGKLYQLWSIGRNSYSTFYICGACECMWNANHVQRFCPTFSLSSSNSLSQIEQPQMIEMMFLALPLLCPFVWLLSCSHTCSSLLVHLSTNSPIFCRSFLDWIDSNKQPFKSWISNMQSLKRAHRDNLRFKFIFWGWNSIKSYRGKWCLQLPLQNSWFSWSPPRSVLIKSAAKN